MRRFAMREIRWSCLAMMMAALAGWSAPSAKAQGILGRLKNKATDAVSNPKPNTNSNDAGSNTTNGNTTGDNTNGNANGGGNGATPAASANTAPTAAAPEAATAAPEAPIRAYQNYDFVPGETILFADDFTSTADGEFPDQWELLKGQAVVNKQAGYEAFLLTDGNYAQVAPRMTNQKYLPEQFTIEYDLYAGEGMYPLRVEFEREGGESAAIHVGGGEATFEGQMTLSGNLPPALKDQYENKWHHIAIVYRKPQFKVYADQYRVLTVPDAKFAPERVIFDGIGEQEHPITFRNLKVAAGGGMNMVGKKFTDAKIVTHGINFDVDKATLRPDSMGVLNQIKQLMASDPTLKFEVDGHTDNSGSAAHNQELSQQRADAVKAQLVSMGVDASRLTTKGYGDTKPLGANDTPSGKANNRRVEFVRVS